jgi:peptide/nickel transport system ATP-binding protein
MTPPLIEIRNVERRFRFGGNLFGGGRDMRAVNGLSLTVRKGEVLGIVGESGCGKSTLARMLLGLLTPSAGEILFDGKAVGSLDPRALARRVQPVFQDPYSSLNPRKTVGDHPGPADRARHRRCERPARRGRAHDGAGRIVKAAA